MKFPKVIYAKKGKDGIIYSAVKIEDSIEYVRADNIAVKLGEILTALKAKDNMLLNKMREMLE